MAFNTASTVELIEQDKVTIFAPEDAAIAAAPATNDTSEVCILCACAPLNRILMPFPKLATATIPDLSTQSRILCLRCVAATLATAIRIESGPQESVIPVADSQIPVGFSVQLELVRL